MHGERMRCEAGRGRGRDMGRERGKGRGKRSGSVYPKGGGGGD